MGRGQPKRLGRADHLQRATDARRRLTEPEHHTVAEELHRFAVVVGRGPLHELCQRGREVRGSLVTAFLGERRVSREVHERHRGRALRLDVQPRLDERELEVLDKVAHPRVLLHAPVDRHRRAVDDRHDRVAELHALVQQLALRRAGPLRRDVDQVVPQAGLRSCDPAEVLAVDPEHP